MLVNTREFQRSALYFKKYGKYTDAPRGTIEYKQYWDNEIDKCLNGVKIGDTYISGYHYFYLNFCKIMRTLDTFGTVHDNKPVNVQSDKDDDFPAFWDLDHQYFNVVERCENPWNPLIDIRGITLAENDFKRKHLFVLKARGKGFSFKGGAMMARNYFLIRASKSFAIAAENEFLIKDGILNKAWAYLDFIDNNTAWRKRRLKNAPMHKQSGFKETVDSVEVELGYKSQIIGVTLKNDPQKARGKRGKLIVWEEVGKFPGFKKAWNIARPSVEDRDIITGFMIAQGTGGTEGANFEDIEEMFYNPNAYNALLVENQWDEGGGGTYCGLFVPSYLNAGSFMDKDGNSHIEEAKEFDLNQRATIAKDGTQSDVDQEAAEQPHTPREACLQISGNIYPKVLIEQHINKLKANKELQSGIPIDLEYYKDKRTGKIGVRINEDPEVVAKLQPITKFPTPKDAGEGCIVMYEEPYRINGIVPEDLYYSSYDPFAQSGGQSLGSFGVYKRVNRMSQPDDICVAEYDGRPGSTLDFDRRAFMLAEFYNCLIGFENDRGDVVPNARLLDKMHLLEPQFTLEYNNTLKDSPVSREYGMHMTESRKIAGVGYDKDWLMRVRGYDSETGAKILNLHTVRSIPYLQECIAFNYKGNFDRVMRSVIARFYEKEMDYTERRADDGVPKGDDFFTRRNYYGGNGGEIVNGGYAASDEINVDRYVIDKRR